MKTQKQILRDKAATYGLSALNDSEVLQMLNFKKPVEEFWTSPEHNAMKEIMRRYRAKEVRRITKSKDAHTHLSFLESLDHEQFWCMYLNRNNAIMEIKFISKGGTTGTVVDVQLILKNAIQLKASGIIVCHNHPSGNNKPSQADIDITKRIKEAGKFMDVALLDHVIICGTEFYSFADEGLI